MITYLKSNWKDILTALFSLALLVGFINYASNYKSITDADGNSIGGWWPVLLDVGSSALQGSFRFTFVLFLGWASLKITLPEAAAFIFGDEFDAWWKEAPKQTRAIVSLSAVAVVVIVGAICFLSIN